MTDPLPETTLGDVIVNGQTRQNRTLPFRGIPQYIWVPPPFLPPEAQRDGSFTQRPTCQVPAARRRLDQDAAAAEATGAFLSDALALGDLDANGAATIGLREFGSDIRRGSTGRIELGPVSHALNRGGNVTITSPGLFDVGNWFGDVHNHPYSNDPRPSQADWDGFQARLTELRLLGLPTNNRFIYIIVSDPTSPSGHATYVYGENANFNETGPEVNPNAQPCP